MRQVGYLPKIIRKIHGQKNINLLRTVSNIHGGRRLLKRCKSIVGCYTVTAGQRSAAFRSVFCLRLRSRIDEEDLFLSGILRSVDW